MDSYNRETTIFPSKTVENLGSHTIAKNFMANVFMWMFVALGISAAFAVVYASNDGIFSTLFSRNEKGGVDMGMLGWVVMLAPIGLVMVMSWAYQRLSPALMIVLFLVYSAVNGISFSFVLRAYEIGSVLGCFLSAAVMFGIMAVMGYTTNQDLTSFGKILKMALIGIIVAMLINFFMGSATMDYIISILGVMIFTGLTAYDVQKLKQIGSGLEMNGNAIADTKKLAIIGALNLYLDFINIFLFLLRLFGGRKD